MQRVIPANHANSGCFITFEGPEGSGKTTQIRLLAESLRRQGYETTVTREPGGTPLGDAVRAILLQRRDLNIGSRAEALLFNAARAQLVDDVIRPALQAGHVVLCDRYIDSTLAYQGFARQADVEQLRNVINFATDALLPHLTFFLDLEPERGLLRKQADAHVEWNRLDQEAIEFHQAVRAGYQSLVQTDPQRWVVIDAAQEQAHIHKLVWDHLQHALEQPLPSFH